MAGKLSAKDCGAIFQKKGRNGSSHYGIGYKDGEIGLYVDECNTAWTDSNWNSNCKSVTIETGDGQMGGDWKIGDKTMKSLIKLCADIAKRNKLGKLVKGKNLTNTRAAGSDHTVVLKRPRPITLEYCLDYINSDERILNLESTKIEIS